MGMDVIGQNPVSPDGQMFLNTVWQWAPLAAFCQVIAPDETKSCRHWQSNDGDGLNAEESLQLADRLTLALADGSAEDWALALRDRYDYQLDRWNVSAFIDFLRACGGFRIW